MFAEDIPAKLFMRFLRMISHIAYERSSLAHGYEFRHYRYIVRRYLLRKDFEISYHFLLFHFLSPLELDCLFRATGGAAWDGEKKANSLSVCGSQRDKAKIVAL